MSQAHRIAPVLFLGAGASAAAFAPPANVYYLPTVTQFFGKVHFPQGAEARGFEEACQRIARWIDLADGTNESSNWPVYDAEKLFGCLELLTTAESIIQSPIPIPITRTPMQDAPTVVVADLRDFLRRELVKVYGRDFPQLVDTNYLHLFKFLDGRTPKDQPVLTFTTNYDTVLESQLRNPRFSGEAFDGRPNLCTGFKAGNPARWAPQVFDEPAAKDERIIRLFKLHGSVTWKWDSSTGMRVPVEMDWREPTGDKDCVIYFGYKSVPEDDPFKTLHDRLKDTLLNTVALVAIGFRFADPYIFETFDMALRANHKLRIICCLKNEPDSKWPLARLIRAFPNQVVLLRDAEERPVAFGENGFLETLEQALDTARS